MSAESTTQIWKETLIDQKAYFCKVNINDVLLFGLIEMSGFFGNGKLVIPVKATSLAELNRPKLPGNAAFSIYRYLGLEMNRTYGEIECATYISPSAEVFQLTFKRAVSQTRPNLILHKQAEKSPDFTENSLINLVNHFQKHLPKTTIQPLSAIEYPAKKYYGNVLKR